MGDSVRVFNEDANDVGTFVGHDAQANDALVKYNTRGVVIVVSDSLLKVRG